MTCGIIQAELGVTQLWYFCSKNRNCNTQCLGQQPTCAAGDIDISISSVPLLFLVHTVLPSSLPV